ncbi:MAG: Hsp70 family protein [Muribaculaceae bacterium]|nr:Hsp70 family protein [Muribaculaceae bacterium]
MAAYGIDLGTTNSCVAIVGNDGEPHVINNMSGFQTTPSVVYYSDDGCVLVGDEAKQQMGVDPKRTVECIKREIGNPKYHRKIDDVEISPLAISSMILKKLVADANEVRAEEGGAPIKDVVITVPAYFGSREREITRQAGKLAGLNVLALIPEPTAAAISYGVKDLNGKTFMIYDLGGGTFDISIMRARNGVLEELANDGDHRLGGKDWDICLLDHILTCNDLPTYLEQRDTNNSGELGRMVLSAENFKKRLSNMDEVNARIMYKNRNYMTRVSREDFEEMTEDSVDSTIMLMKRAIRNSRVPLTADDIDEIILVGGSSYMPMIQNAVTKEFPKARIRRDALKPNLAIAEGAAIYAHNPGIIKGTISPCSYGLGCVHDGVNMIANIIRRGDTTGTSRSRDFITGQENQRDVLLKIYENRVYDEMAQVRVSHQLTENVLNLGKPVKRGTPVKVNFKLNSNGILEVTGECMGNEITFNVQVEGATDEEVKRAGLELGSREVL